MIFIIGTDYREKVDIRKELRLTWIDKIKILFSRKMTLAIAATIVEDNVSETKIKLDVEIKIV